MSPFAKKVTRTLVEDMAEVVPSVAINFFASAADEIARAAEAIAEKTASLAIHGSRMAGSVLTFEEEDQVMVRWVLVGKRPDGKNCEDCLGLHGREMTLGQLLDMKFTTQCNGNCRCDYEPAGGKGTTPAEPLTDEEINAALEAQ